MGYTFAQHRFAVCLPQAKMQVQWSRTSISLAVQLPHLKPLQHQMYFLARKVFARRRLNHRNNHGPPLLAAGATAHEGRK